MVLSFFLKCLIELTRKSVWTALNARLRSLAFALSLHWFPRQKDVCKVSFGMTNIIISCGRIRIDSEGLDISTEKNITI